MNEVARRYDRISRYYDAYENLIGGHLFSKWRAMLWRYPSGDILEVGVGTGKNIPYYPKVKRLIAIDISEGMLEGAKRKIQMGDGFPILMKADIMNLPFKDESFDCVVSTFVFCSVPDPIKGLKEVYRVLKSVGKMYLLEHVLSENRLIRLWEEVHNPLTSRLFGCNVNRDTRRNLEFSGFSVIEDKKMAMKDVFRFFIVKKKWERTMTKIHIGDLTPITLQSKEAFYY